jgi:hypothetical protein
MTARAWDRSLLLTAAAVAIVSTVSVWLAWRSSTELAQRISMYALAPIASAALVSYSLRILRFHYFLTRSGVAITLRAQIPTSLLVLLGATLPNALAVALLARLATLWLWVALGLAVAFALRFTSARGESMD